VVAHDRLDAAIAGAIAAGARGPRPVTLSAEHRLIEDFFDRLSAADLGTNVVASVAFTNELPSEQTTARIAKALERVSRKAPIALRIAADLIERSKSVPIEEGLRLELSHLREIFSTRDAYEGLSSLGKKPPVFLGR
jgi:enoyl-CoA hydratase/3-hydroxyacyl-CoA dehydrogenase